MLTNSSSNTSLDFDYFVNLALASKLSWDSLIIILNDWTPTLAKSKEVIEILVKELQKRQTYFQELEKWVSKADLAEVENNVSQALSELSNPIDARQYQDDHENSDDENINNDITQGKTQDDPMKLTSSDSENNGVLFDRIGNQLYEFISDPENTIKTKGKGDTSINKIVYKKDKTYQCKTCPKCFTYNTDLTRHELIHSGEKPYKCETCEKSFRQLLHLKRHNLIHKSKKPFQCTNCYKCFANVSEMKNHQLIHDGGEKPFQCKTCNFVFKKLSHLKSHEIIHTGEKPFQCEICNKCFNRSDTLQRHLRDVHKRQSK